MQKVNLIPMRLRPEEYEMQVQLAKRICVVNGCQKASGLSPSGEANTYEVNGQELPVCEPHILEILRETPSGKEVLKGLKEKAKGKRGVN